MRNIKLRTIVIVTFVLGVISGCGGIYVLYKSRPLIRKIKHKLKERQIAHIPKASKPFTLCDFERRSDLQRWQLRDAHLELSRENPSQGKFSAKVFLHKAQCPAIQLEDFFIKERGVSNWARYEVISFDIFNPAEDKIRLVLQIKDKKGRRYKQDLVLPPQENSHIEVDIAGLQNQVDITQIGQFALFLWRPREDRVFYLDNLRLLPLAQFAKRAKPITSREFIPKNIEEVYKMGDYFAFTPNKKKWQKKDPLTQRTYVQVPLTIKNITGAKLESYPVFAGIPFPKGELKSAHNLIVVDSQEKELPIQTKILCSWPDKSIKWLLLDMQGALSTEERNYFLRYSPEIRRKKIDSTLRIKESRTELSVVSGPLKFSIHKERFHLFDRVWLDSNNDGRFSESEIISRGGDLVLVHNGREYRASRDRDYKLEVEERGPLKIVLKASGWFTSKRGRPFCQFIVRIKAFKDKSYVQIDHTFVYTGYPENKYHYLYKGKRLPKNETIDAIYVETPFSPVGEAVITFGADEEVFAGEFSASLDFYQGGAQKFTIIEGEKAVSEGKQMAGWLDLSGEKQGLMVMVKDFWQQFPKGYILNKKRNLLITEIWPKKAGELDFSTSQAAEGPGAVARGSAFGVAKTHNLIFYFHQGDYQKARVKEVARGFTEEALIRVEPEWIVDTRALGRLAAKGYTPAAAEEFLERLFAWAKRQKEAFGWYGMIDFGDTLSWFRKDSYDKSYDDWGWHPEGRWGWFNCEAAGTHTGALLQYLRTGEYKYFRFGRDLARHIMDVDTCHYNTVANDKRLRGRIPDDYSQVGSMHRHNGDHWGGRNEETTHTNLTGILFYYYITGDERAREVLDEIGSFFLQEPITYYGHPDVAPQRGIANILWGDVLMYELTGDERYKKQADKLANLFYVGQHATGCWVENYNPQTDRWEGKPAHSFMTNYTLPALIEYHRLTGNKAIRDCILKATEFLSENVEYLSFLDALAYSYWLSGDRKFIDEGLKRLDKYLRHQQKSTDPLGDGMIYGKAYYARVAEFLYSIPWIFPVLQEKKRD